MQTGQLDKLAGLYYNRGTALAKQYGNRALTRRTSSNELQDLQESVRELDEAASLYHILSDATHENEALENRDAVAGVIRQMGGGV